MTKIILLHTDPIIIDRVQQELSDFDLLTVRSAYSLLAVISDLRYEVLIAQESVVEPWVECIKGQRPAMPIITIDYDPSEDELSRRCFRNFVIGISDRSFLDFFASLREQQLRSFW